MCWLIWNLGNYGIPEEDLYPVVSIYMQHDEVYQIRLQQSRLLEYQGSNTDWDQMLVGETQDCWNAFEQMLSAVEV